MDTEHDDMGTDMNCIGCRFWICGIDHRAEEEE